MAGQPRSTGYVPGKTAAETRSDERRNGRLLAFEKPRCLPISLTGGTKGDRRPPPCDPDMILIKGDHRQGRYEARVTAAAPACPAGLRR